MADDPRRRVWWCVTLILLALNAAAGAAKPPSAAPGGASPIGEEAEAWAGPTCERSGRGCSERERSFLYHWMNKQQAAIRAEVDRLVAARGAEGESETTELAKRWADQRLHILDQLVQTPLRQEL